jgi:hypothetical protein
MERPHADGGAGGGAAPTPSSPTERARVATEAAPYDLANDLAARRANALAQLGPSAVAEVDADVWLFASPARDATFAAARELAHRAWAAYFHDRFTRRPDRAVTVYVFASRSAFGAFYAKRFGAPVTPDLGFYDRRSREVFVDASSGLTTLTHELVHPIVEADFPDAPEWLQEGLGALFEAPVFPDAGEVHGRRNWRDARLLAAWSSPSGRARARLDSLFGMSDDEFDGSARDLHYAMARAACEWLDARGELWPFYRAWRDAVTDDPHGERAFERVVGATPEEANAAWVAWVERYATVPVP